MIGAKVFVAILICCIVAGSEAMVNSEQRLAFCRVCRHDQYKCGIQLATTTLPVRGGVPVAGAPVVGAAPAVLNTEYCPVTNGPAGANSVCYTTYIGGSYEMGCMFDDAVSRAALTARLETDFGKSVSYSTCSTQGCNQINESAGNMLSVSMALLSLCLVIVAIFRF